MAKEGDEPGRAHDGVVCQVGLDKAVEVMGGRIRGQIFLYPKALK
jgi:hypothetical protein